MCKACGGVTRSPLVRFGALDTCRAVITAYTKYRYYMFKEKYENYGRQN